MWWKAIIFIVVILAIKFAYDSIKQANSITKQGGMRIKYKTLIDYLLNSDPECKILQEKKTFISVGVLGTGIKGSTVFFIYQTYGTITIQYKANSVLGGEHKFEWVFNEYTDQKKMIENIEHDIDAYLQNMIQKSIDKQNAIDDEFMHRCGITFDDEDE